MKLPLAIIALLAALPIRAADPPPFAPVPFRLESSPSAGEPLSGISQARWPASPFPVLIHGNGVFVPSKPNLLNYGRVLLPVGPVRMDYGQPIFVGDEPFGIRLDAPGPGYRQQSQRLENRAVQEFRVR